MADVLQEYLGTRPWMLPAQGRVGAGRQRLSLKPRKSAGVAWQYCGRLLSEGGQLPGRDVPGLWVSPLGRALVDKRLYLPESWTSDKDRCEAAGCAGG